MFTVDVAEPAAVVAVIVTTYAPMVVPGFGSGGGGPPLEVPPPQLEIANIRIMERAAMKLVRRRRGGPKMKIPRVKQRVPPPIWRMRPADCAAVVWVTRFDEAVLVPETLTEAGLREHVGRSAEVPVPAKATAQVRDTVPEKPVAGTTV